MRDFITEDSAAVPRLDIQKELHLPYEPLDLEDYSFRQFDQASRLYHNLDLGLGQLEKGKIQAGHKVSILERQVEIPFYDVTESGPVRRQVVKKWEVDLTTLEDAHKARYVHSLLQRLLKSELNLLAMAGRPALIDSILDKLVRGGNTEDIDQLVKSYEHL